MINAQTSIANSVTVRGVNVYNGRRNSATFHPAEENSGLIFLVDGKEVPANLEIAKNKWKAISLEGKRQIHLVEHLLSAAYALGIDNMRIEISDGVCPTTNNCVREYVEALSPIIKKQNALKKFWKLSKKEETQVRSPEQRRPDHLSVRPTEGFVIDYTAFYPHKVVGEQNLIFRVDEPAAISTIDAARPPGFLKNDLFKNIFLLLGKAGIHGINERNYLLITSQSAEKHANPKGYGVRYSGEEFVRHKVLDVLGTLALTGRQFVDTEFKFEMTGHKFDIYALRKLFEQKCFSSQ